MNRSGKTSISSMTGVGAYPALENRMSSVVTCACANVLYEKKGAMAYVPLNRTMEQALGVGNTECASRRRSADMEEAVAACEVSRSTNGPCAFLERADDHAGVR